MSGRAKVAAQQMIGNMNAMSVSDVAVFVRDQEKVTEFLTQLQTHIDDFQVLVTAQAEIDHIEKLLLQAKHNQETSVAELETARAEAETLQGNARKAVGNAETEATRIIDEAEVIKRQAERDAGISGRRLAEIEQNAATDRKAATRELEQAAADRATATEYKQWIAEKKEKVETLLRALDE